MMTHIDGHPDSYGGILRVDEEQVQLMKRRGGVGHDLSHLRPKGFPVKNSALTSTGLVPFMERYSHSTREVAQDGRRGALMLSVSIKHPDSEAFIDAKMTEGKVTGANVSVRIDDAFIASSIKTLIYRVNPILSILFFSLLFYGESERSKYHPRGYRPPKITLTCLHFPLNSHLLFWHISELQWILLRTGFLLLFF